MRKIIFLDIDGVLATPTQGLCYLHTLEDGLSKDDVNKAIEILNKSLAP